MTAESFWYAIYTKPRWEKKVAVRLQRKKIEVYCPLNKVVKNWHDRKKTVEEPLFGSYVFVKVSAVEKGAVLSTYGVINFVHWLQQPAVIREEEIQTIKTFLQDYQEVRLERIDVQRHDRVQVLQGPFKNQEGRVMEVHPKTVKLAIPSLGYNLVAQVDKANIEVIQPVNGPQATGNPYLNYRIA